MDTIECHRCHRQCVPRLWTYRPWPGSLRYLRTQHQCPFCGNVMFETGGQLTTFGISVLFIGALFALYIALQIYAPTLHAGMIVAWLFEIGFWAVVIRFIYNMIRKRRNR